MKTQFLLSALLGFAVATSAQPAPKLVNGLPFPLVKPEYAAKLVANRPIILELNEVSLREAIEELGRQSGVELDVYPNNMVQKLVQPISLHTKTFSFDEALDAILDEAGVKKSRILFNTYNNTHQLILGEQDESVGTPKSEMGIFQTRLLSLENPSGKVVRFGVFNGESIQNRDFTSGLMVTLKQMPDMRLPVIGVSDPRLTRAEDDKGRSLLPAPQPGDNLNNYQFYTAVNRRLAHSDIKLKNPAPGAKKLAHLEGTMIYGLATKFEKWEVPDLLAAPQWSHHFTVDNQQFPVTLDATLRTASSVEVIVKVRSARDFDRNRIPNPLMNPSQLLSYIRIEDTNGVVLRNRGFRSKRKGNDLTASSTFYPIAEPVNNARPAPLALPLKLTFDAPVELVQTEIPFSFQDVPIP